MNQNLMLYLHIPFCVRKCNYCDFVSFAGKEDFLESYVQALCNEIRAYGKFFGERKISSVYFGGGTPSILPAELFVRIMETLEKNFSLGNTKKKIDKKMLLFSRFRTNPSKLMKRPPDMTEVSVECNPGTLDRKKLKAYRRAGVNRLSFGLQSAEPEELKTLGRIHTFDDFTDSFEAAREEGFDNINVDLMQAIPGQSLESWWRTLAVTAMWKPEHISAYSLIVEEGTPFYDLQKKGLLSLPEEDTEREMYYAAREILEKSGYYRYEISNYAIPGFECRHNSGYWRRQEYLGLGLNASGMTDNVRRKNTADLQSYLKGFRDEEQALQTLGAAQERIQEQKPEQAEDADVIQDIHRLSHREQMEEFMFLGLRMTDGISKQDFFGTFGQDFDFTYGEVVYRLKSEGFLEEAEDRVFLTDRGIDLSNRVLAEFLL